MSTAERQRYTEGHDEPIRPHGELSPERGDNVKPSEHFSAYEGTMPTR